MKWLKKITASEQNAIQSLLENSNGLKITSVFIALLMFVTINQVGSPIWKNYFVKTGYIEGVPISVNYDQDKYVITGIPETVNVNINGSENNVQAVLNTQDNLIGNLQLNYKGTGNYSVSSEKVEFNNTSNVKITPTISNFDIEVQDLVSEQQSVDINYINGNDAVKGYLLEEPSVSTNLVEISGGNTDVASVAAVRGTIDLDQIDTNKEEQVFNVDLIPYGSTGEIVNGVEVSPKSIEVTQSFEMQTKKVPVSFSAKNYTDGQYITDLCTLDTETCEGINDIQVEIYGEKSKVQASQFVEYQLDFSSYDDEQKTIAITPSLESGIYSLEANPKELSAQINDGVTKKIEDVPIEINNLQSSISVTEELTSAVTIIGPSDIVKGVDADDIKLNVDMTNVKTANTTELNVNIEENDDYNIILPSNTIDVVTEKE